MFHKNHLLKGSAFFSMVAVAVLTSCNVVDSPVAEVEEGSQKKEVRANSIEPTGDFTSPITLGHTDFCYYDNWRVESHVRTVADVNGDGRGDLVGFGNSGVYVALANTNGTFGNLKLGIEQYTQSHGGWKVDTHARVTGDVNGDGREDIVGFGTNYVYVSLSNGNGTFGTPVGRSSEFTTAKGWNNQQHVRTVADVNGDGRADLVAFGKGGTHVALAKSDGTFGASFVAVNNFADNAGGWKVGINPRVMADVNGDGKADIVGLGTVGVYVSIARSNGTFLTPYVASYEFSVTHDDYEEFTAADVNGDGRDDIVAFGHGGVHVGLAQTNSKFGSSRYVLAQFDSYEGGWNKTKNVRAADDINGDGKADIIGYGNRDVYTSLSKF